MRAFIAITLDEQVYGELAEKQAGMRQFCSDINWVEPKDIHLTLKFMDNIDEQQVEKIIETLDELVSRQKPFNMRLSNISAFPDIYYPKLIWLGISIGLTECIVLHRAVEESMEKLGFLKSMRSFKPHMTLGRIRHLGDRHWLMDLLRSEKDFTLRHIVSVNAISLIESELTPKGPIYKTIKEFPFGEQGQ